MNGYLYLLTPTAIVAQILLFRVDSRLRKRKAQALPTCWRKPAVRHNVRLYLVAGYRQRREAIADANAPLPPTAVEISELLSICR